MAVPVMAHVHATQRKAERNTTAASVSTRKGGKGMPIKPENRKRYPADWKQIRRRILDRAGNRCEFCGVENHSLRKNGNGKLVKIVLTIAHLDHTPENCSPDNLRALCQRCHNRYDAKHRAETRGSKAMQSMMDDVNAALMEDRVRPLHERAAEYIDLKGGGR